MSDILKNERLYSISHFLKKNFLFAVFVMIQPLLFERIFLFFKAFEPVEEAGGTFYNFLALKHMETGTIFAFRSAALSMDMRSFCSIICSITNPALANAFT